LATFDFAEGYHFEHLTTPESIAPISGVILPPEYWGKGIGTRLMKELFAHCAEIGKLYVHVSYETVNPNACYFWPKIFKPVIRSVRRCVNKDANDGNVLGGMR